LFSADFSEGVTEIQAAFPLTLVHLEGEQVLDSTAYTTIQEESRSLQVCSTVSEEDIAALIFTGGTTGLPKAAKISHRQIGWNTLNTVIHDLRHGDTYLNVFPLFHTGGMFVYTVPLVILGGTTVVLRTFDPNRVLEIIDAEEITVFAGVPTMYQMISVSEAWSTASLSSLRFCTSGGAPLPIDLVRQYADEKGIQFKQGFGMTEFGPGVFALPPEEAIRKAGSIGRPNFFVDARIVNDQNQEQPVNVAGELILKGPSFCSGYYNNDAATQKVIDADGYFHTGDMAKVDQDGFFYIVDRKKDMFISGGENIYPAEIERVLSQHSAVYMCAVIGIADAKWGEVGKACVVLHDGQDVTEEELLNFLKARLAKYKVPKTVAFLKEMLISGAGKILKRELKAHFEGQ
jgi:fatty-acyl-CoA synthase